jgi:hypothetical protein
MTTPPMWEINLTPKEALKIALVSLNWAAVDNDLGHIIAGGSGIGVPIHASELVHVLDLQKKIEIIDNRRKRGEITGKAGDLALEMRWVGQHYRPNRNMLAHGMLLASGTPAAALWSQTKLKAIPISELDEILDEAQYAAHVSHRLGLAIVGLSPAHIAPLPPRPHERPAQQ